MTFNTQRYSFLVKQKKKICYILLIFKALDIIQQTLISLSLFREIVTCIEGVYRTVVDIVVKGHVATCRGAGQVIEEVAQGHVGIIVDGDAECA